MLIREEHERTGKTVENYGGQIKKKIKVNDLMGSIFTLNLSCFIKVKKTEQNLLKYHVKCSYYVNCHFQSKAKLAFFLDK